MLLLWSVVILLFLAYILKIIVLRLTQRLPPGPWGLPVVGYAPFISMASSRDYVKMEKKYGRIFGNEIKLHEKISDENIQDDFLDFYIKELHKNSTKATSLTRLNLNANGQTLLFLGSDTTRLALVWTYLCLANYPEMQKKVYKEIADFCGKEHMPAWSDRGSLPYTSAFIMEVARWKTIAPAADPHLSNDSGTIGGFDIPKNTIIFANIYAVHMDPRLWGDPEEFRPERFLSADGKTATAPEYWIPFLTGKRSCPGEKLASMQLFLFVTSVVQKFKLSASPGGLSLEENENFLLFAVNPNVSFQLRE